MCPVAQSGIDKTDFIHAGMNTGAGSGSASTMNTLRALAPR
jgi:hypothetical protein